ncbi:hypothetical protein OG607_02580 [Streptomyces sp. NBC_01537]
MPFIADESATRPGEVTRELLGGSATAIKTARTGFTDQIPTDGSCGKLIAAAGWHAWRPARSSPTSTWPGNWRCR